MSPLELQLRQLAKLFQGIKVDYAILGGVAVLIYGEPRLTFDIDVNVMLNKEEISDFLKKAGGYGFFPLPSVTKKFIKATGVIPMKFLKNKAEGRCDFIIAENILEHLCIRRARLRKIYNIKIKIVTPEDLIIHKITSQRPRDLEDVRGILFRQRGKLDMGYITYWLKKIDGTSPKQKLLKLFQTFK